MKIILDKTGKKFNTDWIFRNLTYTFESNSSCAILGRNGSGKSTLLQVISGSIHATEGTVSYVYNGNRINVENVFRLLSYSAPYLELIEEFRLMEMLTFHFRFKQMLPGYDLNKIVDRLGLKKETGKPIRQFSSGMKQRVKLIMAFMSDTPLLLLDEPTTNLDKAGSDWYRELVNDFSGNRTIIVCSNLQDQETGFCTGRLFIEDFKK